jgi:hypothetical protein
MIATSYRVIKQPHQVYVQQEIKDIIDYITKPELPHGAIS